MHLIERVASGGASYPGLFGRIPPIQSRAANFLPVRHRWSRRLGLHVVTVIAATSSVRATRRANVATLCEMSIV